MRRCPDCGNLMETPWWVKVFDVLSFSEEDVWYCPKCGFKTHGAMFKNDRLLKNSESCLKSNNDTNRCFLGRKKKNQRHPTNFFHVLAFYSIFPMTNAPNPTNRNTSQALFPTRESNIAPAPSMAANPNAVATILIGIAFHLFAVTDRATVFTMVSSLFEKINLYKDSDRIFYQRSKHFARILYRFTTPCFCTRRSPVRLLSYRLLSKYISILQRTISKKCYSFSVTSDFSDERRVFLKKCRGISK